MVQPTITLEPLQAVDRDAFVAANQEAFNYGALEEFGLRDGHFEEDGQIISRETIEGCIDAPGAETYWIVEAGERVGGTILQIDDSTRRNELAILFVSPNVHSKGVGFAAWQAIEALHPETEIWETCTPYFEKRNIHFYVNKCGFHIVEFFNEKHPDPKDPDCGECGESGDGEDGMFRFEKRMRP